MYNFHNIKIPMRIDREMINYKGISYPDCIYKEIAIESMPKHLRKSMIPRYVLITTLYEYLLDFKGVIDSKYFRILWLFRHLRRGW